MCDINIGQAPSELLYDIHHEISVVYIRQNKQFIK